MAESYLQQRLKALGISEQDITIKAPVYRGTWGQGKPDSFTEYRYFESDEEDNIVINYFSLTGAPYSYRKEGNKWAEGFKRIRYKKPVLDANGQEIKYRSPKGAGLNPFFPPAIITKWQEKKKIPVLVLTEGEFKAFKGSHAGLDIIGLPSIHGFYSNEVKRKLHEDIEALVRDCQIEKLIFLTDADTLTINYSPGKDLYQRPNAFCSAVTLFRDATEPLVMSDSWPLKDVYFAHILDKYNPESKGLDDLLINNKKKEKAIFKELTEELQFAKDYFHCRNLSTGNPNQIKKYFGLADHAEGFYSTYGKFIGEKEFIFRKGVYYFDGEFVKYKAHRDVQEFMRVGDSWMRVIQVPKKNGETEEVIRKWGIGEIQRDYKNYPTFIEDIKKYKAFCNVPDNGEKYTREISGCYNIYHPLKHEPKAGDISSSITFIKHLFGGEASVDIKQDEKGNWEYEEKPALGDPFTVALDYLTLMFQNPTQILPVPCLVSPENNTGKSTFLKWLKDIYGANATILGNEEFKMSFNSHYITKYIIGIDEGFIDVEKKADKERIKKLATDDRQFLQFKGVDIQEIDFYGKIIICSNDADNLMKIEEEEIRWFIIRVPQFKKEDPLFRDRLREEIPNFLYFLKYRKVFHPRESRAWFAPKYLITEQMKRVVASTKTKLEKELQSYIAEMFLRFRVSSLRISLQYLTEQINKVAKWKCDSTDIKKILNDQKGMKTEPTQRCRIPRTFLQDGTIDWYSELSRPYVFLPNEWLTLEELKEYNSPWSLKEEKEEETERTEPLDFTEVARLVDDKQGKKINVAKQTLIDSQEIPDDDDEIVPF